MVQLYAADINNLPDPKEYPDILKHIHGERKTKTMKFKQPDDRKRCLCTGMLLEKILPLHGTSPNKITIGANGKPDIEEIFFNISHSDDFVICAIGKKSVGCDIEIIGKETDGMAKRFFHPNEIKYLNEIKKEKRNEAFFRLWTIKESYIKMTGEGLRLPLNKFEILMENNLSSQNVTIKRDGKLLPCHFKEYKINGYKVSVCTEETQFENKINYIKLMSGSKG